MACYERDLVYQPVVDLATGRPVLVEALLRVRTQDGSPVPPLEHLAHLEPGDAVELGRWVRERALADLGGLRGGAAAHVGLAVNVDARELYDDPAWADDVLKALARHEVAPPQLTLELTEAASFDRPQAVAALRRLAYAGVQIALDDVGTGYNALALLEALPVTALKIDRTFVSRLAPATTSSAIVRALTTIAQDLGMRVTAEGVETPEQLALLTAAGVDRGQGFLFARPASLAELRLTHLPDDPEQAALEVVRVMTLAGASATTIAARLNADGFRTADGTRWSRESVTRARTALADADRNRR